MDMITEESEPDPKGPPMSEPASPRAENCLERQETVNQESDHDHISSSSYSPRIDLRAFFESPPTAPKDIAINYDFEEVPPFFETFSDPASEELLAEEYSVKSTKTSDKESQTGEKDLNEYGSPASSSGSPRIVSLSRSASPQHQQMTGSNGGHSPKPLCWDLLSSPTQEGDVLTFDLDFDVDGNKPRGTSTQEQKAPLASGSAEAEEEEVPDETPVARPFKLEPSDAAVEWERQKEENPAICEEPWAEEVDKLMALVGLEEVKARFLAIKAKVDTCREQEESLNEVGDTEQDHQVNVKTERFNVILQGSPGTGKRLLHSKCRRIQF